MTPVEWHARSRLNCKETNMTQKFFTRSLAAAAVIAALGFGGYKVYEPAHAQARASEAIVQTAAPTPVVALPDFSALVDSYGPAVVNISVTQNIKTASAGTREFDRNDPFFEFFRRFGLPVPDSAPPFNGLGSGFIVSPDGTILTNAHVVADAADVTVRLTDRREFTAKVIGADPQTDIAVLKIDARNLPTVRLGDSDKVRVGEWVVAIGSPFGFENSVTSGIVSAKARALPDGTYVPFIQTDVAVNPGNSGGPLFNLRGEVIGINSQIYSSTGGYQGLSFAIPIDTAVKIKDQLVQHGKVTRGRIGVTIQEVNHSLAQSFGLKKPGGALVSSVEKDSPAAKAGVQAGDVILSIDGKPISRSIDLSLHVAEVRPGSAAKLDVWRNGRSRELKVTVGEAKAAKVAAADASGTAGGRLGVAVRPLDSEEEKQAGVPGGLLVEDVSGPAAKAGIQPGDIILALNGTPVKSADELRRLVERNGGDTVALLVKREEARIFVPVKVG
jgi:serine protease Do